MSKGSPLIAVRLNEDVHRRFKEAAQSQGVAASDVVRQFILWWLGDSDELPARVDPQR